MALQGLAVIPLLTLLLTSVSSTTASHLPRKQNSIPSWCKSTPDPTQCEHYLKHRSSLPIQTKPDFLRVLIETALQTSLIAWKNAFAVGHMCRNPREKAAWSDCLDHYNMTAHHLNLSILNNGSQEDVQTWLSSALTHHKTCKVGFNELGVLLGSHVFATMDSHVNTSCLISNSLAINNNKHSQYWSDEFPSWVKPGERRLLQSSLSFSAKIVASKDGSEKYSTIRDSVNAAASRSGRTVIYVKQGVYAENVEIEAENIMLTGDGIGKTIITGSRSVGGGYTTFRSATVAVTGSKFMARGITFRNTAGPSNHQAVALRSGSDLSVFYQCSFEGYQDTLYTFSNRQFYKECTIYGTVDFIFGNAAAVLQSCQIRARYSPYGTNTLTAQGRTDPNQNTGISIHDCTVTAASDLASRSGTVRTYLGRPWQRYSRTVFMKTYMDSIIDPAGWREWSGDFAQDTLYYAEYMNTGPGSSTSRRVEWRGYHIIGSSTTASEFTVQNFHLWEFLVAYYWYSLHEWPVTISEPRCYLPVNFQFKEEMRHREKDI